MVGLEEGVGFGGRLVKGVVGTGGKGVRQSDFSQEGHFTDGHDSHFWHDGHISLAGHDFSEVLAHSFFSHFSWISG